MYEQTGTNKFPEKKKNCSYNKNKNEKRYRDANNWIFFCGFTFADLHFGFTFWPLWGRPYTGRGTGRLSLSGLLATFRRHSAAF
jgi:hypothetical protein